MRIHEISSQKRVPAMETPMIATPSHEYILPARPARSFLLPPPAFGNRHTSASLDLICWVFFQFFDFQFFDKKKISISQFPKISNQNFFFSVKSSRQKTLFFDSQGGDRGVRSRRWARREQAFPKLKEALLRSAALEVVIARESEAPRRATEARGKPREERNSRAGSLRHSLRFPRTRVGVGAAWKT